MTATTGPSPLLEFEIDSAPRRIIVIDGVRYDLRRSDDLTVTQNFRLERALKRFFELFPQMLDGTSEANIDLTPETEIEVNDLLRSVTELLLAAPLEVIAKMQPAQQLRLLLVFLTLSLRAKAAPAVAPIEALSTKGTPATPAH